MWPFDQPRNCATIVSKSIIEGDSPILYVSHDEDDHGWQFLDGTNNEIDDVAIVGLGELLEIDPSMADLAHLEPGYHAMRSSPGLDWIIEKTLTCPESHY